jgi:hypothetical protein
MQSKSRTFDSLEYPREPSNISTPPRNISTGSLAKLLGLKTAPTTSSEIDPDQTMQAKTMLFKDMPENKNALNSKGMDAITKPPLGMTTSLQKHKHNFLGYNKNIESIKEDEHDAHHEEHGLTRSLSNQLTSSKSLRSPELQTISCQATAKLIAQTPTTDFLVIDCRYDYEFKGGHIKEALNILCPEELEKIFFTNKHLLYNPQYIEDLKKDLQGTLAKEKEIYENSSPENLKKKLPMIIFHCEFSQKRGPRAHRLLRNRDREINYKNFPHMDYPEVFLLDGGYCNFYPQFPEFCEGGYLRMVDKNFSSEFSQSNSSDKRSWGKKCLGSFD